MDFFKVYLEYQSGLDLFIHVVGLVSLLLMLSVWWRLFAAERGGVNTSRLGRLKYQTMVVRRFSGVVTDILPLLGLFGTVAALLVTFAKIGPAMAPSEIIANFAPGLTTTVSGLVWAVVNLVVLQTVFVPAQRKVFPEST